MRKDSSAGLASNFQIEHLEKSGARSAVSPYSTRSSCTLFIRSVICAHTAGKTAYGSWRGPLFRGKLMQHPAIVEIAAAHGKTPGQIILRWHIQKGHIAIPNQATKAGYMKTATCFPSYSHRAIWIGLMRWTAANILGDDPYTHSRGSNNAARPSFHNGHEVPYHGPKGAFS